MSATTPDIGFYTVEIWHTPQPGFQYEARIYRDGELEFTAGGMTEAAAELAAREWIVYAGKTKPAESTYVRSFVVRADSALGLPARSEPR